MRIHRDFRLWQEQLRGAFSQWIKNNKDEGSLWRGAILLDAEERLKAEGERLRKEISEISVEDPDHQKKSELLERERKLAELRANKEFLGIGVKEKEFIEASINERDRQKQAQEAQRKRDLKIAKRIALSSAGLAIAVITSGVLGFIAWNQYQKVVLSQADSLKNTSSVLSSSNQYFDALISAIKAAKSFQQNDSKNETYKTALYQAITNVAEKNRLIGHTSSVTRVLFSPDSKTIASAGTDGTVKLWDKSGKLRQTLQAHRSSVGNIAFSPDGKTIASVGDINRQDARMEDNTVKLWDNSGNLLHVFQGYQGLGGKTSGLAFSPDSQTIAASGLGVVNLWGISGNLLHTLRGHQEVVSNVLFSPDGKTIISGGVDGTVRFWDISGKLLNIIKDPDHESKAKEKSVNLAQGSKILQKFNRINWISDVKFSPDGQIIAIVSRDKFVRIFSASGKLLHTLQNQQGEVKNVVFSPDGKIIASARGDKNIKLWDNTGKLINTLSGHQSSVSALAFSPDGTNIVSSSTDGTIRLWDTSGKTLKIFLGHNGDVLDLAFSPDGHSIVSGGADGTIRLWDTSLSSFDGHQGEVTKVVFSPNGQTIASASNDKTIKLWNIHGDLFYTLQGHQGGVTDVVFSPDGQTIASTSNDKTVKLWSISGKLLHTFEGHRRGVKSVIFSPDGQTIASHDDAGLSLWNTSGNSIYSLQTSGGLGLKNLAFSFDSKTMAAASGNRSIALWDVSNKFDKSLLHNLYTPESTEHGTRTGDAAVAFSPNEQIVVATNDMEVKLWDTTGKLLHTLSGHKSYVDTVGFSADGKTIISANAEEIKLWDTTGKLLHTLENSGDSKEIVISSDGKKITSKRRGNIVVWILPETRPSVFGVHGDDITSLSFSPDGKTIASSSKDGTIKLSRHYDVSSLVSNACDWVADYLRYSKDIKEEGDRHLCDDVRRVK
jgi:WD40 repeat protein